MPIGKVIAVFNWKPLSMPGSGWTGPKPHIRPSPTQPDHTATAAGAAISSTGQLRRGFTVMSALVIGTLLFITFPRVGEGWLGRSGLLANRPVAKADPPLCANLIVLRGAHDEAALVARYG